MKKVCKAAVTIVAACAASIQAVAGMYYVPVGTPIHLATYTDLNTKHVHSGDRFYLTVSEPLVVKGQELIPAGSTAVGEVGAMTRNGHFGKSGKLAVRVLYIDTPQRRIDLSGEASARGKSGTAAVIGAWVAAGVVAAFVVHGTNAKIRAGTPVTAYLDDDLHFYADNSAYDSLVSGYGPTAYNGR